MWPVSEEHPLHSCGHYVACLPMGAPLDGGVSPLERHYAPEGLALFDTVADGDCGVDVMLQMANLANTEARRRDMREKLRDYLLDRVEKDWMVDLMVACQEVQCRGGVSRSHGSLPAGSENQGPDPGSDPAVAGAPMEPAAFDPAVAGASMEPAASDPAVACAAMVPAAAGPAVARAAEASRDDEIMEALAWSTGSRNEGVLVSLWEALPPWSIKEQAHEFRTHQLANRAKPAVAGGKLITIDYKKYGAGK